MADHFTLHCAAIDAAEIFSIAEVSNALPRTGVPLVLSIA